MLVVCLPYQSFFFHLNQLAWHFQDKIHEELFLYKPITRTNEGRQDEYQSVAVLLINSDTKNRTMILDFRSVPGLACASNTNSNNNTGECQVRDIWERKSLGVVHSNSLVVPNVASHDCAFFVIGEPSPIAEGLPRTSRSVGHRTGYLFSGAVIRQPMLFFGAVVIVRRYLLRHRKQRTE